MYLNGHVQTTPKECGLTQQALAERCKLAVKTIQDIEKGGKILLTKPCPC